MTDLPRPTRGKGRPDAYRNADGKRVPSVTTITGRAGDKGGLLYAAMKNWHRAGELGFPFDRWAYWGKDEEKWGTKATEVGTITHTWIEDILWGADPDKPSSAGGLTEFPDASEETLWQAEIGLGGFIKWAAMAKPEIVESEVPIVSEQHGFAGTLDALARIVGEERPVLLDWKTSNGTYPDYVAQIAAYRQLLRERDGDAAPDCAYLLRVGKEEGDFHLHYWPPQVLDIGWRWFLAAFDLYRADQQLQKVSR